MQFNSTKSSCSSTAKHQTMRTVSPSRLVSGSLFTIAMTVMITLIAVSGCQPSDKSDGHAKDAKHVSFMEKIRTSESETPFGGVSSEPHLKGVKRVEAHSFLDVPSFSVAERQSMIDNHPCSECHTKPLAELREARMADLVSSTGAEGEKIALAHWNINLKHADSATMGCNTCHAAVDGTDGAMDEMGAVDKLATLTGAPIEFNHAYRVCAQCHQEQAKDWSGGAHGKRLGGWAPPRVVKNCTGCHNPHSPALEQRWPSRSSRLPGQAGSASSSSASQPSNY